MKNSYKMKVISIILFTVFFTFFLETAFAQIGINASNSAPHASAMLDVSSTTKGVLFPRMTTTQRNSLSSIATDGLTVYDTDTKGYWFWNGADWVELISSASQPWSRFSTNLYANSPFFSFIGGSTIGGITAGIGNDGTIRVFQPSSLVVANYLNLDGTSIQARQNSSINGKIEMPLKLNPFGGNIGVGLGAILPSAKLHLAGNMKIDGNNTLEFGADVPNKNINAGKIGYQAFGNADALDIVGAGPTNNRKINLFAEAGLTITGSIKLPSKTVLADYSLTEADFTIMADMENNVNKVMNINLPIPSAIMNGRIYIITAINLPNIYSTNGANIGFVNVNNLTINNTYQTSRLYYKYKEGIPIIEAYRYELIDSFTVQCINNQWRIIAQSKDIWFD